MSNIVRLLGIRSRNRDDHEYLFKLTHNVDDQVEEPDCGSRKAVVTTGPPTAPVELEYVVDGLPVPPKAFNVEVVRDALRYKARPSDVFVATYPKSGTSWMQRIVWLLLNLDRMDEGVPSLMDTMTRHMSFLELVGRRMVGALPEPRVIKHHLPFWLSPYHPLAKYVVLVRNPFDVAVSFYYHCRAEPSVGLLPGVATFDDFLERFLEGRVPFGSYFDHVLSWYARRDDTNVLFLHYETLGERPATVTLEIADFLDTKIASKLRGDERLLRHVVDRTSAGCLKTVKPLMSAASRGRSAGVVKSLSRPSEPLDKVSANYVCKGDAEEWKRHFKPDQVRRLRQLSEERMKGTKMWYTWQKWFE
nr:sulfotransferase family cytosolic 1B member 1-like [Rhipicephalus microplus]